MATSKNFDETLLMDSRSRLILLREFPRVMLLTEIRELNCIHDGDFCYIDAECWNCGFSEECLYIISKFDDLDNTNNHEHLVKCIDISRDYVMGKVSKQNHGVHSCNCDACIWLRESETTLSLFDSHR